MTIAAPALLGKCPGPVRMSLGLLLKGEAPQGAASIKVNFYREQIVYLATLCGMPDLSISSAAASDVFLSTQRVEETH
jgi:hypothetical protein